MEWLLLITHIYLIPVSIASKRKKEKGLDTDTFNVFQMAVWTPGQKLYLPPAPVTKVLCSEQYVTRKNIYYHGETGRLLAVGHPWHSVGSIHKVSPNQYRVFEVEFPDPNQFALPDSTAHNPLTERLVWAVVGVQVSRGLPLSPAVTGHPLMNVLLDAEVLRGQNQPANPVATDARRLLGQDVKQTQVLMVGCAPAHGEYWGIAKECDKEAEQGKCPPIELQSKLIEDGDMMDIGYGAVNFNELNASKADVPLDVQNSISVYPDYLKMAEEVTGNSLFFYARKEQAYCRHIFTRNGEDSEGPDKDDDFFFAVGDELKDRKRTDMFFGTLSGSLVATDGQIFNRPYWLFQAQGMNNGILWGNKAYVTVGDNTRGGNITISRLKESMSTYDASKVNMFLRHCEEYKLAFIIQLCSITLNPETVAHLQMMDPNILKRWDLNLQAAGSTELQNNYRYVASGASICKVPESPEENIDKLRFWKVDMKEKLSLDLDQFPLGRRFLGQQGLGCGVKRKPTGSVGKKSSAKRRKTSR